MAYNQPQRSSFPPPPGGAPPPQQGYPQHPNSQPMPGYNVPPTYNPAQPQFSPPPADDSEYYDAEPQAGKGRGSAAKGSSWTDRLTSGFNQISQMVGSETFMPTSMDKECEKAARILRGFCKDGIYSDNSKAASPSPSQSSKDSRTQKHDKVLVHIPSKVIHSAVGLAVFTTARAGLTHLSGSTGSGVLLARLPDGSWSPPSGIQVHGVGAGLVLGVDIYDCVVVINTKEALHAFTQTRMALGTDLAVAAGPWGAGASVDVAAPPSTPGQQPQPGGQQRPGNLNTPPAGYSHAPPGFPPRRQPSPLRDTSSTAAKPVFSYVKSRGFYVGFQVDGTVVTERKDANAAFYGAPVSVTQILRGEVPRAHRGGDNPATVWPAAAQALLAVLQGAEGWHGQRQQWAHASTPWASNSPPTGPSPNPKQEEAYAAASAQSGYFAGAPPPAYTDSVPTRPDPETATIASTQIGEVPPAYVDDGVQRPGVGDSKVELP